MRVEVRTSVKEPYGTLNREDALTASKVLTGAAFKAWVLLALNQSGFVWQGVLEAEALTELTENGYIMLLGEDHAAFDAAGKANGVSVPSSWKKIASLYGVGGLQEFESLMDKLRVASFDDKAEEVFTFWLTKFDEVQRVEGRSKARNALRYDFAVALSWYIGTHFRFEVGDALDVGKSGRALRYNNAGVREKLLRAMAERGERVVIMGERNMQTWNQWLANGDIEVPAECVGKILRSRRAREMVGQVVRF